MASTFVIDVLLVLCENLYTSLLLRINVIYKANKLGESMFVRQSETLIPEEAL